MIKDIDILTVCKYWANILRNKAVPFDELVNEAYVVIKVRISNQKLTDPKLLQKWIKWTMIHYIQDERFAINISKSQICADDWFPFLENFVEDKSFSFQKFGEMKEELDKIVNKICTDAEKQMLKKYINEDKTFREIAKEDNVCFQAVYGRYVRVIERLRREYDRQC